MLTIRNANSSQFFIGTSRSSHVDDLTGKIYLASCLFGPLGPDAGIAFEFKGRIRTGKANRFGERGCSHFQWEGDLTIFSGIRWVADTAYAEGGYYQPIGSTVKYGYLTAPGTEVFSPHFRSGGRDYQFRAKQVDNRLWSSTWRDGLTNGGSGLTFLDSTFTRFYRVTYNLKSDYNTWRNWEQYPSSGTIRTGEVYPVSGSAMSRDSIYSNLEALRRYVVEPVLSDFTTQPYEWGKMAQKAVEAIAFADTNGLQYFPELLTLKELCKGILGTDIRSGKALASAFLAWKYGVESSFRDSKLYYQGVNRFLRSRTGKHLPWRATRAGYRSTAETSLGQLSLEHHYKIFYRYYDDAILNGYRVLREWGLAPTVTAAWDAVPMSFVLDWFVDVGSFFESIDVRPQMAMYKVLGVTKSVKKTQALDPSCVFRTMLAVGNFAYATYERTTQRKADEPHFAYESPQGFDNYVEAAALIIQRRK